MESSRKRAHDGESSRTETIQIQPDVKKLRVKFAEKTCVTVLRDAVNISADDALVERSLLDFRVNLLPNMLESERSACISLLLKLLCATTSSSAVTSIARLLLYFARSPVGLRDEENIAAMMACVAETRKDKAHSTSGEYFELVAYVAEKIEIDATLGAKLFGIGHTALHSEMPTVRCCALRIIHACRPYNTRRNVVQMYIFTSSDDDARVRRMAVRMCDRLVESVRVTPLAGRKARPPSWSEAYSPAALYSVAKRRLLDTDERVRKMSIDLVCRLAQRHAVVEVRNADNLILRLYDDAFANVCFMMNDTSIEVRTEAAVTLGKFTKVNRQFLEQTLSKKLLPSMKLTRDEAQYARNRSYRPGRRPTVMIDEWSRGRKMHEAASTSAMDYVSLMSFNACGAFVTGLEDESGDVRYASISSLGQLIDRDDLPDAVYADTLHSLADMFNDDIVRLRLAAMHAIRPCIKHTNINDGQLDLVLDVLHDSVMDTRMGARHLLQHSPLASAACLRQATAALITNMMAYPQDTHSVYKCMQSLGANHGSLLLPLVGQLLNLHAYLDVRQPRINDPIYLAKLILVVNAARSSADIRALFKPFTWQHYEYLRSCTHLVPQSLQNSITPPPSIVTITDITNTSRSAVDSKGGAASYVMHAVRTIVNILASEDAQMSNVERHNALTSVYPDLSSASSSPSVGYMRRVCRMLCQTYLLCTRQYTMNEMIDAVQLNLTSIAALRAQYSVPSSSEETSLLVRLWRGVILECRIRLLLLLAVYSPQSSPLQSQLSDGDVDERLVSLVRHVVQSNAVGMNEITFLRPLPLCAQVARNLRATLTQCNPTKTIDAFAKCLRRRDCVLLEPSLNVDSSLADEVNHDAQNANSARDVDFDDGDEGGEGESKSSTRVLHMPKTLSYVVGMFAELRLTMQMYNYTAGEILNVRIRVEHSGGNVTYERVCASDIHAIVDKDEEDETTVNMHRVSTRLPISSRTAMMNESTVRVSLVMCNAEEGVQCEQNMPVRMANVDEICVRTSARTQM